MIKNYTKEQSLESYVKNKNFLKCDEIYDITLSLCDAIERFDNINSSLVYIELNPSNIMILENRKIILEDASISKVHKSANKNILDRQYNEDYILRQHILWKFSRQKNLRNIGMIMYFMATGKIPLTVLDPLKDFNYPDNMDSNLKRIIQKCFHDDYANKYLSIEELSKEITIGILRNSNDRKSMDLQNISTDLCMIAESNKVKRVERYKAKKKVMSVSTGMDETLVFLQSIIKKGSKTPILCKSYLKYAMSKYALEKKINPKTS
jgi:serine/threonine protein kinase